VILSPDSRPYGRTYGEWSATWWQWAFSIQTPDNPLLDETGAKCGVGQSGPVFFLAGVINVSGSAERTCSVPSGRALFFPILNFEDNPVENHAPGRPPRGVRPSPPSTRPPWTLQDGYAYVQNGTNAATGLHASIDTTTVSNPASYRAASQP